jgi:dienelactone hydrolase
MGIFMKVFRAVFFVCLAYAHSLFAQTTGATSTRLMGVQANVETTVYLPESASRAKAALVLHTSSGLKDADHRYAKKLAAEGFVVAVPAFMKAYDISEATRRQTWSVYGNKIYADFLAIMEAVASETKIDRNEFHAIGFSNGGHWSALLAARGDVKSAVSYYGAFSEGGLDKSLSTFRDSVNSKSHPLLILHGTIDAVVSSQYGVMLEGLYRTEGAQVAAHYFEGAGHSFERQLSMPPNQAAGLEAWNLTLQFLTK